MDGKCRGNKRISDSVILIERCESSGEKGSLEWNRLNPEEGKYLFNTGEILTAPYTHSGLNWTPQFDSISIIFCVKRG